MLYIYKYLLDGHFVIKSFLCYFLIIIYAIVYFIVIFLMLVLFRIFLLFIKCLSLARPHMMDRDFCFQILDDDGGYD